MSESEERKVLHADFFTEDPEPRLIAGRSKSSGNWTFPPYLADPVSFQDDIEHILLLLCVEASQIFQFLLA